MDKTKYGILLFLLLTTLGVGCEIDPLADVEAPLDEVLRNEMLEAVNTLRSEGRTCGSTFFPPAPPLAWDTRMEQAAVKHSADMAANRHYGHTGTDGSSAGDRLTQAGYRWAMWGENIAKGFGSTARVMEAWVESPSHCENLMNPRFTHMGAAVADWYWTQDFGRPR